MVLTKCEQIVKGGDSRLVEDWPTTGILIDATCNAVSLTVTRKGSTWGVRNNCPPESLTLNEESRYKTMLDKATANVSDELEICKSDRSMGIQHRGKITSYQLDKHGPTTSVLPWNGQRFSLIFSVFQFNSIRTFHRYKNRYTSLINYVLASVKDS